MDIAIYRPYFYIIQHIESKKYYCGVRYGKNANPDNLLKSNGYKTSSDVIKQIILDEGLESFVIRKIRVFETGEQALKYESRFLRRVNASFNNNFLNLSNNSTSTLNVNWGKLKKTNLERYGFESVLQNEEIQEKIKKTNLERYGYENVFQNEYIKEKRKQTMVEKYGFSYATQIPEVKENLKQTNLEKYGCENPSQNEEVKEKQKQTCLENFGCEYPMQSEEIKEKYKHIILEKYGYENISQLPEVKEKLKQKRIFLSNQPIALEILKYKEKYNLKLGPTWIWKPQEFLENLLTEIKNNYETL